MFRAALTILLLSVLAQNVVSSRSVDSLRSENHGANIMNMKGDNPDVIIKNRKSGLVLDGSGSYVTAQQPDGSRAQIWRKEPYNGKWAFINNDDGHFLDIEGGQASAGANLVTNQHSGHLSQEWIINSDGTIASAADGKLAIDIADAESKPGSRMIVSELRSGDESQIFDLIIQG